MGSGRFIESQDDGMCIADVRRELKEVRLEVEECCW